MQPLFKRKESGSIPERPTRPPRRWVCSSRDEQPVLTRKARVRSPPGPLRISGLSRDRAHLENQARTLARPSQCDAPDMPLLFVDERRGGPRGPSPRIPGCSEWQGARLLIGGRKTLWVRFPSLELGRRARCNPSFVTRWSRVRDPFAGSRAGVAPRWSSALVRRRVAVRFRSPAQERPSSSGLDSRLSIGRCGSDSRRACQVPIV
jgi:hypothetical protein